MIQNGCFLIIAKGPHYPAKVQLPNALIPPVPDADAEFNFENS